VAQHGSAASKFRKISRISQVIEADPSYGGKAQSRKGFKKNSFLNLACLRLRGNQSPFVLLTLFRLSIRL
jgi:hypothetical protein